MQGLLRGVVVELVQADQRAVLAALRPPEPHVTGEPVGLDFGEFVAERGAKGGAGAEHDGGVLGPG